MNITEARLKLASDIRTIFPQLPVFAVPPTQVVTPSAVVITQECEQRGSDLWSQTFEVQLIGPSGDNEAAIAAIEAMLLTAAQGLSALYAQPISWRRPNTLSNVGQVYLTGNFNIVVDVVPDS